MSGRDRLNQLSVRTYLDETVVPVMMQALAAVSRERPEDPVDFVAQYLLRNNPRRQLAMGGGSGDSTINKPYGAASSPTPGRSNYH